MRSRAVFFSLAVTFFLLAIPESALAARIPFFGPIVPEAVSLCPASFTLFMDVINRIILFLLTIGIVFVLPLLIAYAGFLFVINPAYPEGLGQARKILWNAVIGIIVALAGWLIVDTVMVVLTPGGAPFGEKWSQMITTGTLNPCLIQQGALETLNQTEYGITGFTADSRGVYVSGKPGALCAASNTACSPGAIQDGAKALGMNLSAAQSTVLSCIAITESSGNPNTPKSNTGACGTFQITTQPGNWGEKSFHRPPCSKETSCNDAQCNLQTALLLFSQRGYQPWTGKRPDGTHWNPKAVACEQQYGSS